MTFFLGGKLMAEQKPDYLFEASWEVCNKVGGIYTVVSSKASQMVKVYKEKSPHPVRALDGLNLTVKNGEIFGLLGRNGAGKTPLKSEKN